MTSPRDALDRPPRTKLQAFADECPEVRQALGEAAVTLRLLGNHALAARLLALIALMDVRDDA